MESTTRNLRRGAVMTLIATAGIVILLLLDQWQVSHWREEKNTETQAVTGMIHQRLESTIASRTNAIESIAALFKLHPDTSRDEFDRFCRQLMGFNPPIRALQFADSETRIVYVYPPKGNEITLSRPMVLLSDPKRGPYVTKAINHKKTTLQGPFPLRQGGTGAVARAPVFISETFHGLAIGVFDVPVLISEALAGMDLQDFMVQLKDSQGTVFHGSEKLAGPGSTKQVKALDTSWTLTLCRKAVSAPPFFQRALIWCFGGGFLFAAMGTIYLLRTQTQRAERLVNSRTQELNIAIQSLADEIAERKQVENDLLRSREMFRKSFDNGPMLMSISDIENGTYLEVNKSFVTTTGYSRKEALGRTSVDLGYISVEDRDLLKQELLTNGRVAGLELALKKKSGETLYCLYFGELITVGGKQRLLSLAQDITQRKISEEERDQLRLAIEQANEIVVITDAQGTIQYANPAFEHITGFTPSESLGKTPRILKSGVQDLAFYEDLWETILSGRHWSGKMTNRRKDGRFYTAECSISPIVDRQGKVTRFVWISRDMTNEMELEKRVAQAQKMEVIGTLAGGIAHDFNNLLFPLVGFAEMLKEDITPDSPSQEHIEEILNAAFRSRDLVRQILTFSRQGDQELNPMRLQSVIKEAVKLLQSTLPATIEIRRNIDPACGPVLADPTQIHQIIMNLGTNAYHAMEETGGELNVTLKQITLFPDSKNPSVPSHLPPGDYALLTFSDTGSGIPEHLQERIFDPYFTTKRKGKGTGLGLSVVQGIVKTSKGEVVLTSGPEKGTTVQIYLPINGHTGPEGDVEAAVSLTGGREHLLLVDDEKAIVRMIQQMLERLGYTVTSCTSSLDALERFSRSPDDFDLLVTDMTMPKMTGMDLILEIRRLRPEFPTVICTGFSERINEKKAKEAGINGFVMKPVIRSILARTIRSVLDGPVSQSEA